MANRYPLIFDTSDDKLKELPSGDNLNLSGNDIVNASNINTLGDVNATGDVNAIGDVNATGDITTASDIKLKINIKKIDNPLDKVLKLRGVEYDRIDMNNKHQIGVIAQEVERVIPELISEIKNIKTVSYGNITAILIEAIKEQQIQISIMKEKIEKLEQNKI